MVKKFKDILGTDFSEPLLTDLLDETFTIDDVRFETGSLGDYAIVTVGVINYRTSSSVLISQLRNIVEDIKREGVEVTLRQKKRYLTFE